MLTITFTGPARAEMVAENITMTEVRNTILDGEAIEEYPADEPFPSRLVLAFVGGRQIHVVVATASDTRRIVVTAYRPDLQPDRWDATFRHRRARS